MQAKNEVKKKKIGTDLHIFLQMVLSVCVLIMAIFSIFEKEFWIVCESILGILMFLLAYNNQKVYKRNFMTYGYLIVGILIMISIIWEIFF